MQSLAEGSKEKDCRREGLEEEQKFSSGYTYPILGQFHPFGEN